MVTLQLTEEQGHAIRLGLESAIWWADRLAKRENMTPAQIDGLESARQAYAQICDVLDITPCDYYLPSR